ncbi:hypothetical protein FJT64_019930 [Amphibalanus amphitrite]|uniref:Uncharacterized protein n=1 Tax=Amphibalanus amphitrite TaxID=1232801 RepID=A0A6A4WQ40_AMPAM|nr:uncharacterized protein LOC122377166 [Amphibalanus amphitrite]XP_043224467.1 uncharacterized protein LOC122382763 [Amphibalanus amphitrite]KAF0308905.1 hypothetical protein FJT64_019930 [Amphibalanus amphitrite]
MSSVPEGRRGSRVEVCPLSLQQIGQKFWLQTLRGWLRLTPEPAGLWQLQRYLAQLPAALRAEMLHTALAPADTRDQLTNTALALLSAEVVVHRAVYLSFPRPGQPPAADLRLVLRHGDGLRHLTVYVPEDGAETRRLLRELTLTCGRLRRLQLLGATDALLKVVSWQCPLLQELDVSGCSGVTDQGLRHLAVAAARREQPQPPPLRRLGLQKTEVSVDGVLELLETLPLLESVACSQTVALLEQLDVPATFGLRELPEFQATGAHLRNFAALCPHLSSVTLVFQEAGVSLQDLALLPHLQHLTFRCKEPYLLTQQELGATLWRLGHQLRTLAISGDVYETIDVAQVAVYCPGLEVLKLPSLTLSDGEAARALTAGRGPLLDRLHTFEYDCLSGVTASWGRDVAAEAAALRALLRRAGRLTTVRCRPFPLVDDDLETILEHNPLAELEVLEIGPAQLGLRGASTLLRRCPSLCRLGRVKTWHGIGLLDIVALRSLARALSRANQVRIL